MFGVEGGGRKISSEPLWVSQDAVEGVEVVLGESAAGEDVATAGVDAAALPPWLVCGICFLSCGGGFRTIVGGGFSIVRIY